MQLPDSLAGQIEALADLEVEASDLESHEKTHGPHS